MQSGWIKIHRKFLEWEWFDKPEMVQLFLYLLLKANTETKEWHGITIQRGQLPTSLSTIARDLKLGLQTVRTCINRLKSTSELTSKSTSKYTIITICNYDKYQYFDDLDNRQINKQPTSNQQADQQAINRQINKQEVGAISEYTDDYGLSVEIINKQTNGKLTSKSTTTKEYNNIYNINNNTISSDEDMSIFSADADAPTAVKSEVEEKKESFPFKKIKDEWNTICTAYPKLHVLSESRKNKIRNRIEEMGGIEKAMPLIKLIFEKMMASPFLKGDSPRGWKASFDWVFTNDKNWVKVYEGVYDPRPTANQTITTPKTRYNGTTDVYSNGNAGYEARQRIFRGYIREKLDSPDPVEPDISGYY